MYSRAGVLLKVISAFRSGNLALSTVSSIYSIRKVQKTKLRNKMKGRFTALCKTQMSNRSKNRKIELINKEVRRKRKERSSIEEIDLYI